MYINYFILLCTQENFEISKANTFVKTLQYTAVAVSGLCSIYSDGTTPPHLPSSTIPSQKRGDPLQTRNSPNDAGKDVAENGSRGVLPCTYELVKSGDSSEEMIARPMLRIMLFIRTAAGLSNGYCIFIINYFCLILYLYDLLYLFCYLFVFPSQFETALCIY